MIYAALLAIAVALLDYHKISRHLPILHGWQLWLTRATIYAVPMAIVHLPAMPLHLLAVMLMQGACIFAVVHRALLNGLRRMPLVYLSPSNGYDWMWMHLMLAMDQRTAQVFHQREYHLRGWYQRDVHTAGRIAYAAEAIFILGSWAVL